MWVDGAWVTARVAATETEIRETHTVLRLQALLSQWAIAFAQRRTDVASPTITWPRRGLLDDESSSFLRALDAGFVTVDPAGFVALPAVRAKTPAGRYALLSKSGAGVSINLEYLIQIGATAELVIDHGWSPADLDFERSEFDAIGLGLGDRVLLVMEAKARVSGPDSLEKLLTIWMSRAGNPGLDMNNNAGRKYRELQRLCRSGRVLVWLVADGARWTLVAELVGGALRLIPAPDPTRELCLQTSTPEEQLVDESFPYEARYHRPSSVAAAGRCSQHGVDSCEETPIISFQDRHNRWQSGCQRALDELVARGEIAPPTEPG